MADAASMSDAELIATRNSLVVRHNNLRTMQSVKRFKQIVSDNPINPAFVELLKAVNEEIIKRKLENEE